ncbi:uncharacterized protein BYT42DRAFT_581901 [Radiomyces spectabilis]|uniref:uncharacterized protein n=1 Tax=Radiomyces spectabilis TaxID=64574 RepID=UPI00221FD0EC|nr:uncharacterized protein BYT42DRAFT_581901 [Radiomyces spectabilis]KAI8370340.1 hypothetical protein BYT42DRAFT_581901 [Radiomyces spectabilis]
MNPSPSCPSPSPAPHRFRSSLPNKLPAFDNSILARPLSSQSHPFLNDRSQSSPLPTTTTGHQLDARYSKVQRKKQEVINPSEMARSPIVYPAFLSRVAFEMRQRVTLGDRIKNSIEYKNAFDGQEAVDKVALIINTLDRQLAVRVGRALATQRFFHDVNYENRLIDSSFEIYQFFYERTMPRRNTDVVVSPSNSSNSSVSSTGFPEEDHLTYDYLPNGVFTELTHCYVPTCLGKNPCYSYSCPKRNNAKRHRTESMGTLGRLSSNMYIRQQHRGLWADTVPSELYATISGTERKRQENIYELIYTEDDFIADLEYLEEMWVQPLLTTDIIPSERRNNFVAKVFRNFREIHQVNARFLKALQARQCEHPIVFQVGDIILDFVIYFEPFITYGARQHEAKDILETELYLNPSFAAFAEETERLPCSYKLELNGYLTKPTTRLGRYTLLLNEILKHTPSSHPDQKLIPKAVNVIKGVLHRVNAEAGKAKNRFDIDRIHQHLSFKYKMDETDLQLTHQGRSIVKQGILRKSASLDSTEYQVILFDHYLIVAKVRLVHGIEQHYVVQKKPIPIALLLATIPDMRPKRSSSILPHLQTQSSGNLVRRASLELIPFVSSGSSNSPSPTQSTENLLSANKTGYPILFKYLGRQGCPGFTLYAPSNATRKPWIDKIRQLQATKDRRQPVFDLLPAVQECAFHVDLRVNHMITFNRGQQYLLATDDGVYVGHTAQSRVAHKVLQLERVTQVEVLEIAEILLILADRTLWEYPLDVVNSKPDMQPPGRKVQSHVSFFHVGVCLQKTLVCVPRVSSLKSTISTFEPTHAAEHLAKKQGLLERLVRPLSSASGLHLKRIKDCYIPSEVWAIELSPSKMLVTCPRGVIMIDMQTDKPQQLLNPADKNLSFITEREREESPLNLRQISRKRVAIFRTPRKDYFICYDEYAFYIDGKGNRTFPNFLIEWEGYPEAFAFNYPYVMAFDPSFIEIRNIITGELEQVIRGTHIKCLNNGHKAALPLIFGTMTDLNDGTYQYIFQLTLHSPPSSSDPSSTLSLSNLRI